MSDIIETISVSERVNDDAVHETLLGRRARAHRPRVGLVGESNVPTASVPPAVPGDFVIVLGAAMPAETLRGLAEGMVRMGGAEQSTSLLLSWLEFVEIEVRGVRGFGELEEGLRLLRGAVMSAGAALGELYGSC